MENPTLPTNWLAALSNARSASRWLYGLVRPNAAKPPCQPLTVVILSGFSKWKYEVSSLMIFL